MSSQAPNIVMASQAPRIKVFVMKARGLEPNVRLHVLDRAVYHVHSAVLILQSRFFSNCLLPLNTSISRAEQVKYDFVTTMDEGGWYLVPGKHDGKRLENIEEFVDRPEYEAKVFENFICALYGKAYDLKNIYTLCGLADHYGALPAVSRTITDSILLYGSFQDAFSFSDEEPQRLINVAVKFHHKVLFQECMIYLAGKHIDFDDTTAMEDYLSFPKWRILDPQLKVAAKAMYTRTERMIAGVHALLIRASQRDVTVRQGLADIAAKGNYSSLPSYYRKVLDWDLAGDCLTRHDGVRDALEDLMQSFLTPLPPHQGSEPRAGQGEYTDFFLCGLVLNEEFPWDSAAEDW